MQTGLLRVWTCYPERAMEGIDLVYAYSLTELISQ